MFEATDRWREAFPGASVGALVMKNVSNPANHPELDSRMSAIESEIRKNYSEGGRPTIRALPTIQAYTAHKKKCKKNKNYFTTFSYSTSSIKQNKNSAGKFFKELLFQFIEIL